MVKMKMIVMMLIMMFVMMVMIRMMRQPGRAGWSWKVRRCRAIQN